MGVWYALRARFWFVSAYVSDVNVYCARGATVTNMWHGIPLKKIEFDIDSGPLARLFHAPSFLDRWALSPAVFRPADYLISPSEMFSRTILSRAFRVPVVRCVSAMPPRVRPLLCDDDEFEEMLSWCDDGARRACATLAGYAGYHVYMPTWRDTRPRFLADLLPHLRELSEMMMGRGEAFVVKPHPNTPGDLLEEFSRWPNIVVVSPGADAYPILRGATTLVTDYSSIYFDFLFTKRHIVFFPFDLEQYVAEDRGLYFAYDETTPGPRAQSVPELMQCIREGDAPHWQRARERVFAWAYGGSEWPPEVRTFAESLLRAP
jgi:CDP-glycerol glycerophosphotransferase (TagB/SpsB family)